MNQYKNAVLQKIVTRGFAGTVRRPVFLCMQMKQHDLDFPTREKYYFLFIRSDCIFVEMVPLSRPHSDSVRVNFVP